MPILRNRKTNWSLMWVPFALIVSFSLYFVIKWGLKPKPIPQINPTRFENLEQIGAVIYRRLRPALRQEKMLVLGSSPWVHEYERVWNGFIATAREDKWSIDLIYENPNLRPIKEFSGLIKKPLNWPQPSAEMVAELKESLRFRRLILVHTSFNHSAHRGDPSLAKDLEVSLKRPWTALTMLGFAVVPDQVESLQPPCHDEVAPDNRTEYAACAAIRISRRFLRKRLDPNVVWAAMERHGLKDYFFYIYQPQAVVEVNSESEPTE